MKNFVAAAMVFTALVVWGGSALGDGPVYRIRVDGLACPFCAYGVEKNILALKGVEKLDIDMEGGFITVVMETGSVLKEETARRAVGDSGFTLRAFEVLK